MERSIGWLASWLIGWLHELLIHRLFGWLTDWLFGWLTDWLIDWLVNDVIWKAKLGITLKPISVRGGGNTTEDVM